MCPPGGAQQLNFLVATAQSLVWGWGGGGGAQFLICVVLPDEKAHTDK